MTGKEICLSTIIIILHSRRAELEKFEVIFFNGRVVQLVRTLACHARGRRFDPDPGRQFASVAQSVEQGTENPRVIGSIPIGGTINADVAHPVERHLAKVEVASSSLVGRSMWKFSSAGRASALQAEGQRFEPVNFHHVAR